MEAEQIGARFTELKQRWKRETAGVSSVTKILLNPNYLKIIGLGSQVVPCILESLQNEPDHWFAALQALTDYDPGPCGNFDATREKWLEWGLQQGYLQDANSKKREQIIVQLNVDETFTAAIDDLSERTQRSKAEVLADAVNLYYKAVEEWEQGRGVVFESIMEDSEESLDSESILAEIGGEILKQDNRCTAYPIFQVRGKRRIYGMDPDYADNPVWIDLENECEETDPPEDEDSTNLVKTGYVEIWEVITCAFTEKACLDYIERNRHRHSSYVELGVYEDSLYRNPEMIAIYNALISIAKEHRSNPES